MVHGLDQLFIVEEVPIGDEEGSKNEGLNADDDVEWVELVEIPEDVPEKPKVQLKIRNFCSMKNKLSTQNFLYFFRQKNPESPEFFHLLHFQTLKKCQQIEGCQQIECQHP